MVEVEQRPLRALEEHALPLPERAVDEQGGVDDVRAEPLREALVADDERLELERLEAVDPLEPHVLLRERDLDLLAEDLRVEEVLDADPEPSGLVGVRRADPAPRGADLERAEPALGRLVERSVPRHDHVRVPRQAYAVRREAAPVEVVELGDELLGIDHAARADRALLARRRCPTAGGGA